MLPAPISPLSLLAIDMGVDVLEALRHTDFIGYVCSILLAILSIFSGYLMFSKFTEIRSAAAQSDQFIEECLEGSKSLPDIYKAASQYPSSPLATLLREAYVEYEMEVEHDIAAGLPLEQRVQLGKTSVESALERTIASEMRKLESRLIHLATVSTLAPFIGLFGTVWGVLAAFQALGRDGNASIAALAPGISTALMTTIFGLVVAIPAVGVYNFLAGNVAKLSSQMDSFAHELSNVFQKHLLRRG